MSKIRLVNLLDDFALGGVLRGLGVFNTPQVQAVAECETVAVDPDRQPAPKLAADIIVTHFPPSWWRLAFFTGLRLRNPSAIILHVEHSYTREWAETEIPALRRFEIMLHLTLRLVDHVVGVSHAQAKWLAKAARLPAGKVDVIYPFSENPRLDDLPLPDFATKRRLVVGAYGRFHRAKGFDQLINAYEAGAFPNTDLLIGGYGPLEEELTQRAKDIPGISFFGKVRRIADFVGKCDIIAIPSRWEAYGQVGNEARQGGRPILVSGVGGLAEQVGAAGLILDFGDVDEVGRTFASLTPAQLDDMARAARHATRGCGAERYQAWADLIVRLMEDRASSGRRRRA